MNLTYKIIENALKLRIIQYAIINIYIYTIIHKYNIFFILYSMLFYLTFSHDFLEKYN